MTKLFSGTFRRSREIEYGKHLFSFDNVGNTARTLIETIVNYTFLQLLTFNSVNITDSIISTFELYVEIYPS